MLQEQSKPRLWTRDFILAIMTNLLLYGSFQLFPTVLPVYAKELGAADHQVGWLTGVVSFCALIARPLAGISLDRFGRRGMLLAGSVLMLLTTVSYAFFPLFGVILLLRFIHGVGWGFCSTASTTIATDFIVKQRFGEGMGFFSLSSSIALALSPALALTLGLRPSIWLGTLLLLPVFALAFMMPDLSRTQAQGGKQPGAKRALFEKSAFWATGIAILFTTTHGTLLTFLALYAAQRGIENIGGFFTVYAVSMLLTRPLLGKMIDRYGYGSGILPGAALLSISLLLIGRAQVLWQFLAAGVVFGIGYGALYTSSQTMAVAAVPLERRGAANATYLTGFDTGIGLGSVGMGMVAARIGYSAMFSWLAVLPLASGLLFLLSIRRKDTKQ